MLFLTVCFALFIVIPQSPSDSQEAALWMSQVQTRFGSATEPMAALGLFSIGRSPIFRLALAALAFALLVRTVDSVGSLLERRQLTEETGEGSPISADDLAELEGQLRRRGYRTQLFGDARVLQADRWPWAELAVVTLHLGCLILLVGLVVGELWGWQEYGILGGPGEVVVLPDGQAVLVTDEHTGVGETPPGVRLYLEGTGPDLTVESATTEGVPLEMQQAPGGTTSTSLKLRVTDTVADTYVAIPSVGLVIRMVPEFEAALDANSPLRVQVYRTPSGEMAQEVVVSGDISLYEGDTHITVNRSYYLEFSASSDPGYWFKVIGLIVTAISLLVRVAWPPRRFWFRRDDSGLVGGGDLPAGYAEQSNPGRTRSLSRAVLSVPPGILGMVVAGMALMSLDQTGSLWDGSVLQVGLAILLMIWVAARMVLQG
jgi:hypothetical protein